MTLGSTKSQAWGWTWAKRKERAIISNKLLTEINLKQTIKLMTMMMIYKTD